MWFQWLTMTAAVLAVFAVIGVGIAARSRRWLTAEADQSLLKLVINILTPGLILHSTLGNPVLLKPANILLPPLVGFATVVGGFALARLAARLFARQARLADERQRRTFALCVGLYNYGFVPIPLALALFGNDTLAVLLVHNVGVEIALWTVGILLISGHVGAHWHRRLLNAPSITIAASLLLNLLGRHLNLGAVDVPQWAADLLGMLRDAAMAMFHMLGASAIPLSLVLIGATVADVYAEARFTEGARPIAFSSLMRLGILPALFLLLAYGLPAPRELKHVILLQAAMPSAVFPIVLARHYSGHSPTAVRIVIGTSLLSLATMPAWLFLGRWLLAL